VIATANTIRRRAAWNLRRLRRITADAYRPRDPIVPESWCPATIRLDPTTEATTVYSLDHRPWWRAIINAYLDHEVRSITIQASTQVGKTLQLIAILLWLSANRPAPAMVVLPDQTAATEFRDRVYASAKLSGVKIPPAWRWNTRYIDLGTMRVYLAWSGSRQRLRGRPCRYVFLSETDAYKGNAKTGNPIDAAHQRSKAFFRSLHFHESSPSGYPSEIAELERAATARYRWHVVCPCCGHKQELRFFPHKSGPYAGRGGFGGLKTPAGEAVDRETAKRDAHYVCEANGCRIDNLHKQALLESGEWVAINGGAPGTREKIGFHLWAIFADTVSFGDLAAEYVEAKAAGRLAEFFGNWLGLEYQPEQRAPQWQILGKRAAWIHPRGTVPPEAWFLTAGADKQGENNGARYVIRAWAPNRTSWLVDWGWIERQPGDENELIKGDLKELSKQVLERTFPIHDGRENPLGRRDLRVKLSGIDSNHLPKQIHAWMRSLPDAWTLGELPRVRAIRGDHKVSPDVRFRKHVVEQNTRDGEKYEGGLEQWGIYVYPFYDELLSALNSEPGKPGAWYVTADAISQGKHYLQQVCNFVPRVVVGKKTGRKKTEWVPKSGNIPVDFWDCEIYARVMAEMVVGDLGWDPAAWEAWRLSQRAASAAGHRERIERAERRASADPVELIDAR
jgi:phage terminase large subunit GpA-like protein